MMTQDDIKRLTGSKGSDLYDGAATYKTSDGTLMHGLVTIYIRESQAAMITSMKLLIDEKEVAYNHLNIVGAKLFAGDMYTFEYPICEIVIAGGSFIGYRI